jgi:cytidine deaminase
MRSANTQLTGEAEESLIARASEVRLKAYAPYSHFKVGAAIRTHSGDVFIGCNVENGALGATICAERVALFSAIAAGHESFSEIALMADQERPITPCGTCRQVLSELAPTILVIMANTSGDRCVMKIEELLPFAFNRGS